MANGDSWGDFSFGGSDPSSFLGDSWAPVSADTWTPYDSSSSLLGGTDPYGGYGQADAPPGPYSAGAIGAPGAGGGGGLMGWGQFIQQPSTLFGLGGGLAGLIGTLMGGGRQGTTTPNMSPMQKALGGQAAGAFGGLQQFAGGTSPWQQLQLPLLQALAGGQGLPPGYQKLVEQAFQPQLGDLFSQAARQGQARGFYDAPATSPPGGAILGPGLSNIQGQEAQAKLGLMQSLPGLFNQPTQIAANAAGSQGQGLGSLFASYPRGSTTSAPLGPQIGQGIGQALGGIGQAFQQQNQQMMDLWNRRLAGGGGGLGGLSYNPTG